MPRASGGERHHSLLLLLALPFFLHLCYVYTPQLLGFFIVTGGVRGKMHPQIRKWALKSYFYNTTGIITLHVHHSSSGEEGDDDDP